MNDEPVIEARALRRRFGKLTAVDGVDLEVHQGEVFGFLGPNGAGKSTLIRMLVGLLPPSEGTIRVLGHELPGESERLRSKVGYMTQKFSLYEDLSIEENLRFAAEIFGLERTLRSQRVEEVLAEYELGERRGQRPATLSGGWKQRLALAVANIHQPSLLVLDEPTAGVDPDRRRAFWEKIFEIASRDATVLVSTHYMDEAVRCHRLCMMIRGRPVAIGSPAELTEALEGRVVEIETRDAETSIAELRTLPQVSSVTQLGDRVHVLLSRDAQLAERVAPELERHLRAAGQENTVAQAAQPNLEDVFVALNLGETLIESAA
ncbi:MAG: ABC transporter ATP-binding protein [bacterium]|nr:ABC transporter ATP-binding protein [bacterium]